MPILACHSAGPVWCTEVPARDPEFKFDTTERFLGVKQTEAPAVCPAVPAPPPTPTPTPGYGSPSSAFMARSWSLFD